METVSWVFWAVWGIVGLGYELYAVRNERKNGALPLTRVVRDRLMKRSPVVKVGVLAFLAWLGLHFTQSVTW
jgi:hypothetical protein